MNSVLKHRKTVMKQLCLITEEEAKQIFALLDEDGV
jgi:hypothetical protein